MRTAPCLRRQWHWTKQHCIPRTGIRNHVISIIIIIIIITNIRQHSCWYAHPMPSRFARSLSRMILIQSFLFWAFYCTYIQAISFFHFDWGFSRILSTTSNVVILLLGEIFVWSMPQMLKLTLYLLQYIPFLNSKYFTVLANVYCLVILSNLISVIFNFSHFQHNADTTKVSLSYTIQCYNFLHVS